MPRRASTGRRRAQGRPPTRSGGRVRPQRLPWLLGAFLGGAALVVLAAVLLGRSRGPAEEGPRPVSRQSLEDLIPHGASPPAPVRPEPVRRPRRAAPRPVRPLSFYEKLVDQRLWEEAKRCAREAEQIWAQLRAGRVPPGMTREQARKRAQVLFARALDKANEFLAPVESRYRNEAQAFLRRYDDIMLAWQRKQRSLIFGFHR